MQTPGFGIWLVLHFAITASDSGPLCAQDWPMWRYDAQRTAAAPDNPLPSELQLLWQKDLSARTPAWDDPLNLDLMTYDRVFEPIVIGGRLMVGFNDRDKLLALDARTGKELWSFHAEGPVRLPPAGWRDRVYFSSDDGFLYCVDVDSGQLIWKFRGAPSAQLAIGNRRLISAWPARGGPVVRDGTVYFAASIWPFMGTFLYALDAQTGAVEWVNDSTGSQYIKQPHSAPSFAGVAPQGALVATARLLLVPGGRSVPAALDRADGTLRYFELNAGGKGTGGSFVAADDRHFYVHTRRKGTRAFDLNSAVKTAFMPNEPVLDRGIVYSAETEGDKPRIRAYGSDRKVAWEVEADGTGDLILAGRQLIAAGDNAITMIDLPEGAAAARIANTFPVVADIQRLIAADRKLFAVTIDGRILAFGEAQTAAADPVQVVAAGRRAVSEPARQVVDAILARGDAEGYAMWLGDADSPIAGAMFAQSPFTELAVFDGVAERVDRVRRRLDARGVYGTVTVHHRDPTAWMGPKYVANMIFVDVDSLDLGGHDASQLIPRWYQSVRPYGGLLYLLTQHDRQPLARLAEALELEQAVVQQDDHGVIIRRQGALPGSADWTHQYGDVANTLKSNDRRVKLPLGILWFGGSSNMDVLPRHGHGPPEQVVGGRLFIQGMNSLSARDVYTGRVLWKREFDDLGTFDVYYDATYDNTPLNPKYNQVHIPGANARGTNYVATEDGVYIVEGSVCHVLDPATGQTRMDLRLPKLDDPPEDDPSVGQPQWGFIGVYQDLLIGGRGFAMYRQRHGISLDSDKKLKASRAGFGGKSLDRAASDALVGFDRHSGRVLWTVKANHSFWHNGIVAGGDQIYCLDRNPREIEEAMRRRGISRSDTYRIVALDCLSGRTQWEIRDDIFGTWLGYSEQHDLLLQASAAASDRLFTETGVGMAVYNAGDGSLKWKRDSLRYSGPCILHNDLIITNANSYAESAGAFYLRDGRQKMVPHPLTGQMQPWKLTRAYGCNNIIASENLLTFRSGAAGYYDLLSDSGTGNLGGFKSGCTSNLVVAGGVLNAPDYTRTCSCAYQNQTSLALVHMPEVEMWSVNSAALAASQGKPIDGIGINFGAPGDRRDSDGLLWLEHPAVSGTSPPIEITMNQEARPFRHHSSALPGNRWAWVLASGLDGVTDLRIALKLADQHDLKGGIPVSHGDDDAEEDEQGNVSTGSSDLELTEDGGAQLVGVRFNDIELARGSEIRNAYIQFTCDEPSIKSTALIIAAEDTGHADRFSSDRHDLSSRTRTQAEVGWSPPPWLLVGGSGKAHRTPNLAPIIQAVTSRDDWEPGNSLAFLFSGTGKRVAAAFRSGGDKAPRLVVDADRAADPSAAVATARYRVRLFFGLPGSDNHVEPVFDVYAQGQRVLTDVTPGSSHRDTQYAIHELQDVAIATELQIRLVPKRGKPVLSGLAISRQTPAQIE